MVTTPSRSRCTLTDAARPLSALSPSNCGKLPRINRYSPRLAARTSNPIPSSSLPSH